MDLGRNGPKFVINSTRFLKSAHKQTNSRNTANIVRNAALRLLVSSSVRPRFWLVIFVVLQVADGVLTYAAVERFGAVAEGNPIVATWIVSRGPPGARRRKAVGVRLRRCVLRHRRASGTRRHFGAVFVRRRRTVAADFSQLGSS